MTDIPILEEQYEAVSPKPDPGSRVLVPTPGQRCGWLDSDGNPHWGVVINASPALLRAVEVYQHPSAIPDQVPCLRFELDQCGRYVLHGESIIAASETGNPRVADLDRWANVAYVQPSV